MSIFERRTRTVSFRLSEEEYKELKDMCIAHGIRSMSDLARLTTRWWIDGGVSPNESLVATVRHLWARLQELDSEVKRLADGVPTRNKEDAGLKVCAASGAKS